ncbi:aminotransferase class I/II-fold pyridoxal phosphate-dependent enzyme [Reichenbachiella carrageenanivorans]|uniref:Aminotransferase class I/II-fold pyridoxal phosphate-dependent enzyme n=1 Tax=Reichenbachiella carrageenanivorans TaxID=2979869 RepID=A0ABY6D6H8_9BACT|nr:aminotransferase class I/II-fold pyridoxal phosphate-dependent enzyme [Reichenbachiella carrageenanivorans]UXX81225.1 aminotransferase class I/II-fold pyridoxal phosphate-dependent enzyme [Reichenbachiella carrageenanivorans]
MSSSSRSTLWMASLAPFGDMIALAEKYNAKVIVDEAHSTGLYGAQGAGKLCALGLEEHLFARVHTFGKAMGVHGAVVCGSQTLIDYLINFARPFIYTTALPVHSLFSIDAAFDYLSENMALQTESKDKIFYFNSLFKQKIGNNPDIQKLESNTPIQPIIVPGNIRAKTMAQALQKHGFDVRPILSPTVKEGSERLRISIHTHNTEQEIAELVNQIALLA